MIFIALRGLVREWRSGELGVLLLALTIAVAALTGVGFVVNRVNAAVGLQASEVLAADLRLVSPQPMAAGYAREAARRGVLSARSTGLLSVVFNGERSQLSNVRAVGTGYPLRGRVRTASAPFAVGEAQRGIPARAAIWADSRLLTVLGARVGSSLAIGSAMFRVERVLISRPDQDGAFTDLVPTVLMNEADLPATQLIQPGSRVSYAQLFAGARADIDSFKAWLVAHKLPAERLRDIEEASPQIRSAVDRAGRFLTLASLVSVLVCAIAVAISARQYVRRHLDSVALLKTMGASRRFVLGMSGVQLLCLACLASVIGGGLGYAAQEWLIGVLRRFLNMELPPASLAPLLMGCATAITVLAGFALPPLLQLARVPALRVLRRDVGPPPPLVLLAFGPAVLAVSLLLYWVVLDVKLFLGFAAGLIALVLVLTLLGLALVAVLGGLRGSVGIAWRYGLANLARRRLDSVVQIVALGVGMMALMLLTLVRHNLDEDWRRSLPADLPNYFFVNIPPAERGEFVRILAERGARVARVLPMIRGRLTAINGRGMEGRRFDSGEGGDLARREQNLTWATELGPDNRIVAGRWWTQSDVGKPLVSLAREFQKSLHVNVGDRLTFDIAGEAFTATVASIREVKWDSFQPNFFIVFAPGVLERAAGTYMTSAYVREAQGGWLAALARRFPSVSIFDINDLLGRVRSVIDRAALAVQGVFLFTLAAGLTVLLAVSQSSAEERRHESAVLRTLGARRRMVLEGVLAEFAVLGTIAALVAAAGAVVGGYFVSTRILWMPFKVDAGLVALSVVVGVAVAAASGWLATRSAMSQPPIVALQY